MHVALRVRVGRRLSAAARAQLVASVSLSGPAAPSQAVTVTVARTLSLARPAGSPAHRQAIMITMAGTSLRFNLVPPASGQPP